MLIQDIFFRNILYSNKTYITFAQGGLDMYKILTRKELNPTETLIEVENLQVTVIKEPDAQTQSR